MYWSNYGYFVLPVFNVIAPNGFPVTFADEVKKESNVPT